MKDVVGGPRGPSVKSVQRATREGGPDICPHAGSGYDQIPRAPLELRVVHRLIDVDTDIPTCIGRTFNPAVPLLTAGHMGG